MKKTRKTRRFTVVLERDEDGIYVASIPALAGCHTQGRSPDQAMRRIREAAELWLEVHRERQGGGEGGESPRRDARLPGAAE